MLAGRLKYSDIITAGKGTISFAGNIGRKLGMGIGSGPIASSKGWDSFLRFLDIFLAMVCNESVPSY
jgi:hypothetical protein